MSVGLKKDKWEVTIFIEEHTHPMMSREEWTRYYRSHRKLPYEDYMLIKTLHNRNADTSLIMATLGDLYGNLRTLPYTNRDVANIRTKLRNEVSYNDMSKTVEYFQKLQAESPRFYYATKLDENNAVRALFWVDALGGEAIGVEVPCGEETPCTGDVALFLKARSTSEANSVMRLS
jgi:hypothetical protein